MEVLKITCVLRNGFASNDPWSPALDGILAYWYLREQLGEERFAVESVDSSSMTPVDGLPLAKTIFGDDWWYQCSSPLYESRGEFLRYYHRRFDAAAASRYLAPRRARVDTSSGPFKAYRLSERVMVTPMVDWYAVGDKATVERLLKRCSFIGAKTGAGFGRVKEWRVTAVGDEFKDEAMFNRPLPVEYAMAMGRDGHEQLWGIRPPGRIRQNQRLCVMAGEC